MSTTEDFENAPVGATATHPNGNRAMKTDRGGWSWVLKNGNYFDDELMERRGYTLNPPVSTTVREALDLAWELAHEVKEGQVIPEGTQYLILSKDGLMGFAAHVDFAIRAGEVSVTRTLDPLPEPEPDWLDAPAVMARLDSWERGKLEVFTPADDHPDRWNRANTKWTFHWNELRDVTPLYPKGKKNEYN